MIATEEPNFDVLIIGAGLSGINFAYRLQERRPDLSYVILEGRNTIGGTWELFKYPGIRSDSDLYTFSFPWYAWKEKKSIAEGPLILQYMKDAAAAHGIDKKIRLRHRVNAASWSSDQQIWTLDVNADGESKAFRTRFLLVCTGYYDYQTPLQTVIPGIEDFGGKVIHPQFWPQDFDHSDKDVVIIGSGATAITLLPAMAEKAKHVTMLQRSPSYVLSQPREDRLEKIIRMLTPTWLAVKLIRFKWLMIPWLFVNFCAYLPNLAKRALRAQAIAQLPPSTSVDPHFKPSYNPFEQRMCFCPDGDFYAALRSGRASVVTGHIDKVTKDAIKLKDGRDLHPDVIVTATGLKLCIAGGVKLSVDGRPIMINEKFIWKNCMLQDLPNAFFTIGYVNASWTLGADATSQMVCRMLKKMKREGKSVVVPRIPEGSKMKEVRLLNLTSTYVEKAKDTIPRAGEHPQWQARTSYFRDIWQAWFGDIETGVQYIRPNA